MWLSRPSRKGGLSAKSEEASKRVVWGRALLQREQKLQIPEAGGQRDGRGGKKNIIGHEGEGTSGPARPSALL